MTPPGHPASVLVIDDNSVDREMIRRLIGREYTVSEAPTAVEGLRMAETSPPDCVLLDHRLPDNDGVNVLAELVEVGLPVVMLTGCGDERLAVEAMKRGAADYLTKDALDGDSLRAAIRHATEKAELHHKIHAQQTQLTRQLEELARASEDLRRSNEALRDSQARLRVVLQQLPGLVWTTDASLHCTSLSGGALEACGVQPKDCVGRGVADFVLWRQAGEEVAKHHAEALAGASVRYEVQWADRVFDCHVEALHQEGRSIGTIGVAVDRTDAWALEQQNRRANKLEAIGRLAGGVAHDFNNVLTAIMAAAGLAAAELDPDHPAQALANEVLQAAQKGAAVTRQLLTFARGKNAVRSRVDLAGLAEGMCPLLQRLVGEDLEIKVDAEPGSIVHIDPSGLEQVLLNLVVNARDATPEPGTVEIQVRRVRLDRIEAAGVGLSPGDYVKMSVTDWGRGMSPDMVEHIFEPFYTTKEIGKGTGLGLATSYGIVQACGGAIDVDSEVDRGTVFSVYIPSARELVPSKVEIEDATAPGGDETILVVEDERSIRDLVVRALRSKGYRILPADGPEAAGEVSRHHPGRIDLLLTDVVMPHANGIDLYRRLVPQRPGMKVLYMSGYPHPPEGSGVPEGALVLAKPFDPALLLRALRAALDRDTPD